MKLIIRSAFKCHSYFSVWQAMKLFTEKRDENTCDEIWVLQHEPVFTQGQAGKAEHILNHLPIPLVHTDRGGQITYHGPGQLMVYFLFNLKRLNLTPRGLVSHLEQGVIHYLQTLAIVSQAKPEAPGVYIGDNKVCSIGLRIKKGCSYHGLAFNIHMDLTPFSHIHPCGYKDLQMTQLSDYIPEITLAEVTSKLIPFFINPLYSEFQYGEQNAIL